MKDGQSSYLTIAYQLEQESHSEPESEPETQPDSIPKTVPSHGTIIETETNAGAVDPWLKWTTPLYGTITETETKADDVVDPWLKWSPWRREFFSHHFGNDLLIASWLFVLSSAFWGGMAIDALVTETDRSTDVSLQQWCQLVSATMFTLGSFFMVGGAHPVYMAGLKSFAALKRVDDDSISQSFAEKYFTGNDVLIAGWFFAVCTLPFVVLGVYLIGSEPRNAAGYLYLIGAVASFVALGVWIIGALPDNIQSNGGMGSTHVYDSVTSGLGIKKNKWDNYYHTDVIIGMWLFLVGALIGFSYGVLFVATQPTEVYAWLTLATCATFLGGAALMVYTSYPENTNSTAVANFFLSLKKKTKRQRKRDFYVAFHDLHTSSSRKAEEDEENKPLLQGDLANEDKENRGATHVDGAPDIDPENSGEE